MNSLPQVQRTCASTYSGWISVFIARTSLDGGVASSAGALNHAFSRAHQVRGRPNRAGGGCLARTSSIQSSSGSVPSISRESAEVTGASSPARSIACASSRTVSSASTAWPRRSGISAAGTPCGQQLAGAAVARGRRQRRGHQVAGAAAAHEGARLCRRRARPAPAPRGRCPPRPCRRRSGPAPGWRRPPPPRRSWPPPPARRPPGRRTPRTPRPARWNTSATRWASGSECEAHTSPAPDSTISRACAGPPTQAVRSAPNARSSATVGGVPSGGTRPLASDTMPAVSDTPSARDLLQRLPHPLGRHGQEQQVGALELVVARRRTRRTFEALRQRHARQVVRVLARVAPARCGLLGGAAQQRGAHPGALEQQRHGGAEGARAHDGGAAGVLAGIAKLRGLMRRDGTGSARRSRSSVAGSRLGRLDLRSARPASARRVGPAPGHRRRRRRPRAPAGGRVPAQPRDGLDLPRPATAPAPADRGIRRCTCARSGCPAAQCHTTDRLAGAACWLPPGGWRPADLGAAEAAAARASRTPAAT